MAAILAATQPRGRTHFLVFPVARTIPGIGFRSLQGNVIGNFNTAVGAGTLFANVADENTATGAAALLSDTTGDSNTANGAFALFSNTEGYQEYGRW